MNIEKYFNSKTGRGVLATSNKQGVVDLAVYSKPHIKGPKKIAFIMKDRLSHRNLKSNPNAAYMFMEEGSARKGVRLYLKMTGEKTDLQTVLAERRRSKPLKKGEKLYLVYFRVTKARTLVGDTEYKLQ